MRGLQRDAAVSAGPAQPGSGGVRGARPATRWPLGWLVVVVPALAELVVGGYRIGVPSLWRDEAATISGSRRSLAAIAAMVQNEDAVHGPYYVLMHPVIAAGGISAPTVRLPSLIAMCVAAGLTAALGRRLAQVSWLPGAQAVGLLAGLALTAVPLTTRYAQEARPYALATLFAVAASYALVRALASPVRRWWAWYAAALLLAGLFNLFACLLAVAHGVSLAWLHRAETAGRAVPGPAGRAVPELTVVSAAVVRRWLAACAAVAVLLAPVAILSVGQSAQLSWVHRPGFWTLAALLRDFAGSRALIPVAAVLALLGCAAGGSVAGRGGTGRGAAAGGRPPALTAIALPWLVLPPALLIAVSLVHPVYVERYVLFCLPALAVLTAAGLVWLATLTRRALAGRGLGRRMADLLAALPSAALVLVIAGTLIGPQREIRQVTARPDDLRGVAAVIAKHELRGDAILYLPRDTALAGLAYPRPFRRLRDIGLAKSPVASGTLRGLAATPRVVAARLRTTRRVWTVQWADPLSRSTAAPAPLTRLLSGLHLIGRWRIQSVVLRLFAAASR